MSLNDPTPDTTLDNVNLIKMDSDINGADIPDFTGGLL